MLKILGKLFLTAFILGCLSTLSQAQNDAVVVGQIDSATARAVRIEYKRNHFMLEDGSFETVLDGNNVFSFRVKISESRAVTLFHRNESVRLFLTPGDTLKLHFKSKNLVETITFDGSAALHNDYLVKADAQFSETTYDNRAKASLETASAREHAALIDGIYVERKNFFDAYPTDLKANFSNEFLDFVLNDNTYWRGMYLMEYVRKNGLTNPNPDKQVDDTFFNFLFETDNAYHKALNNQNYIRYLDLYLGYIREKSGRGKQTDGDTLEIRTRTAQKIRTKGQSVRILEEPYLRNEIIATLGSGGEVEDQNLVTGEKFKYVYGDTLMEDYFVKVKILGRGFGWVPQSLIERFDKSVTDTLRLRRFCYQPDKEFCGFEDNLTGKVLYFTMAKDILLGFMYDQEAYMKQRMNDFISRNTSYDEYNVLLRGAFKNTLTERVRGEKGKVSIPPSCELERYDRDRTYYATELSRLPLADRQVNGRVKATSTLAFTTPKGEDKAAAAKVRAEAEAKAKLEADAKAKLEADNKLTADAKAKLEADAKAKAADELRLKLEADAKAKIAEEERQKAEEARIKAENEAKFTKAAEENRLKAEEEVKAKAAKLAEEARIKADLEAKAAKLAEENRLAIEAKKKAEEAAKAAKIAETARLKAEEDTKAAKIAEENRLKAEAKAKADAEAKAAKLAEESRLRAEAEAKALKIAEEKAKAEASAKAAKLAEEARAKADLEAKAVKIAEENRLKAEVKAKAEADTKATKIAEAARLKAEDEAKAAKLTEENRLKVAAKAKADAAKLAEEARLKVEDEAKALKLTQEKAKAEAAAKAAKIAEEARLKAEAEAKSLKLAEEKAKAEAAFEVAKLADEARIKADLEAKAAKLAEENRLKAVAKAKAEADAKAAKLAEEARLKAEADAKAAKLAEEVRLKAEAETKAAKIAGENRLKAEARAKTDADAKAAKIAEIARLKAEADAKAAKIAEENRLKAEEKAKAEAARLAEIARVKAENEAKALKLAEEKVKAEAAAKAVKLAEEARLKAENEAKAVKLAQEKAKIEAAAKAAKLAEEARLKAENEAKSAKIAEENRLKAEAQVKAEEATRLVKLAEETRLKAEAVAKSAKIAEEERLKAEAIAKAEAKAKADAEAKAARLAEEARIKVELKAKAEAEAQAARIAAEAKAKADAEAKAAKFAEEARLKAEAKAARLAEDTRLKAEAEARAAKLAEENRKKAEAAKAAKLAEEARLKAEAEKAAQLAEEKVRLEEENKVKLAEAKAKLDEEARIKLAQRKAELEGDKRLGSMQTPSQSGPSKPSVTQNSAQNNAQNQGNKPLIAQNDAQNQGNKPPTVEPKPRSIDSLIKNDKPIFEQNKVTNATGVADPNVIINDPNDKKPKNPNETRVGNLIYIKQPDGTFKVVQAEGTVAQTEPVKQPTQEPAPTQTPSVNSDVTPNSSNIARGDQPKVRFVAPKGIELDTTQEIIPVMDLVKLDFDPTGQFVEFKGLVANDEMPRFTLTDINGKTVTQEEMKNKVIFIDFWASWCGPCVAQFSHVKILMEKYKNQDVLFLFISIDENMEAWKEHLKYNSMAGTHSNDKLILPINFMVSGIPNSFIVSRSGKIAFNSRLKSKIKDDRMIQLLLDSK